MLQELLKKIDANHQIISVHRPFEDPDIFERLKGFYNTSLIWSSNAIEGYTYDLIETDLLITDGITAGGKPLSHALAVVGLNDALKYMYDIIQKKEVIERDILYFHNLLRGSLNNNAIAGQYRNINVSIGGSSHELPDWQELPQHLETFYTFLTNRPKNLHPVEFAALAHQKFVIIHPFADGNGRVARLLMNTILIQNGYTPILAPPMIKREYYRALEMSRKDNASSFSKLMAEFEYASLRDFIRFMDFENEIHQKNERSLKFEAITNLSEKILDNSATTTAKS
jgi:Fic family protein